MIENKLAGINVFPSESAYKQHLDELSDGDLAIVPVDTESLRGKSAYEIALEKGFNGTATEWLLTLRGEQGYKGEKGDIGDRGLSAYDVAVEEGYPGSKTEWLLSLRGAPGESGSGLPVGFEYFTVNPNLPSGSLPLFGGLYSREIYADLWNYAKSQPNYVIPEEKWQELFSSNNGNVPFYSFGDGEGTFRVPSLNCWIKGANGLEEVGSYLEAGLPNIEGTIYSRSRDGDYPGAIFKADGSFYLRNKAYTDPDLNWTYISVSSNAGNGDTTIFSAKRSNSIYGNSNTVQPPSIVGMWLVKAYGTVIDEGNLDTSALESRINHIEEMLGDLNTRLESL